MKYLILGSILIMSFSLAQPALAQSRYEPDTGCYLGIALDWAELATEGEGENSIEKFANGISQFNFITERKHVLVKHFFFFPHGAGWEDKSLKGKYPSWCSDPAGWASIEEFVEACEKTNTTPVITIEPWIFDDYYKDWGEKNPAYKALKDVALHLEEWNKPVFIIFANEMNGSWYPWSEWVDANRNLKRDAGEETGHTPKDYRSAFRNVANLFHKIAPNVAMVWAPNQGWLGDERKDNYTSFYPGDEYVDWMALDYYERGWTQPNLNSKLWGGQLGRGLTHDSLDDPATGENESVNFYKTFCEEKNKPLMLAETASTCTYRYDLKENIRRELSHNWKAGYWNPAEYGWIGGVYGTTYFDGLKHTYNIDKEFPLLKAVIWFQVAKEEDLPAERKIDGKKEIIWFNNAFCDYRIGYNAVSIETKYEEDYIFEDELELYKKLIKNPYFLSDIKVNR